MFVLRADRSASDPCFYEIFSFNSAGDRVVIAVLHESRLSGLGLSERFDHRKSSLFDRLYDRSWAFSGGGDGLVK